MRFAKWQALGNDYIIVEQGDLAWELTPARIARICEPHFGVGSDGLLLLGSGDGVELAATLRIFNPDGSEAGLSGNGAREAILHLRRSGAVTADQFTLGTAAGPIRPRIISASECALDIGQVALQSDDFPGGSPDGRGTITAGDRELEFQHVAVGNPQCAIEWPGDQDGLRALDLPAIAAPIERDPRFPNRTNVSLWQRTAAHRIVARIFERGVGETLSSGTGACGAAVAAVLRDATSPMTVELDGGELSVAVDAELRVTLTGWAKPVYEGQLCDEFVAELAAV